MDSRFLEFFGNYLIQAAKWQKLVEQSLPGKAPTVMDMSEFGKLFQQVFDINESAAPAFSEYARIWQQTLESFQSVFGSHARTWGWISRTEYQRLLEKCESLEKTIQKQEQIISQLRSLLDEKGLGQVELLQRFQTLIQDQSYEFQTLMRNLGASITRTEE